MLVETVENEETLLNEIAGIIDASGGVEYIPGLPHEGRSHKQVAALLSHTLFVHNVTLNEQLHARARLAAARRAAGLFRPLPRWASASVVASRAPAGEPIQHACLSPAMLLRSATDKQRRLLYIRAKEELDGELQCPICWQNKQLAVKPGTVVALYPALEAAGWDAGHLRLAHAEHGIAAVLTDERRKRGRPPPLRP